MWAGEDRHRSFIMRGLANTRLVFSRGVRVPIRHLHAVSFEFVFRGDSLVTILDGFYNAQGQYRHRRRRPRFSYIGRSYVFFFLSARPEFHRRTVSRVHGSSGQKP